MLCNGRHSLGPETATLQVRTSREGAYEKVGHDLVMDVSRWAGTLAVTDDDVRLELDIDPRSLKVRWGFNGADSLTDKDRASIGDTIDTKVLRGAAIRFRSTEVTPRGDSFRVTGRLEIGSATSTISFDLRTSADGTRVDASATVVQSAFAIKPYSAMLGTLKVRDSVEIVARATLSAWAPPVVAEPVPVAQQAQEQPPQPVTAPAVAPAPVPVVAAAAPYTAGLRLRWSRS